MQVCFRDGFSQAFFRPTCFRTESGDATQTGYLTQSLYTDTGPVRCSTDPMEGTEPDPFTSNNRSFVFALSALLYEDLNYIQ